MMKRRRRSIDEPLPDDRHIDLDAGAERHQDHAHPRGLSAGVTKVHAHRWRHNFAHEWKGAGGDTGDLMLLLGWTSDDMLRHYGVSAAPNALRKPNCGWGSTKVANRTLSNADITVRGPSL